MSCSLSVPLHAVWSILHFFHVLQYMIATKSSHGCANPWNTHRFSRASANGGSRCTSSGCNDSVNFQLRRHFAGIASTLLRRAVCWWLSAVRGKNGRARRQSVLVVFDTCFCLFLKCVNTVIAVERAAGGRRTRLEGVSGARLHEESGFGISSCLSFL